MEILRQLIDTAIFPNPFTHTLLKIKVFISGSNQNGAAYSVTLLQIFNTHLIDPRSTKN